MYPTPLISALAAIVIGSLCITANADTTTCVPNRPISQGDLIQAFQVMQAADHGTATINSRSLANAQSSNGLVQFYVCNNAFSTRFFTLDSTKQSNIENAYALCNGNAFFITESDEFSYGGDVAGIKECGF
jgi:hypothetical protein